MSKSNLINALYKIDAAEGLVRYTNTVKPFHSKLLDVLIEYIYKEDIRVKVKERITTAIQQFKPTNDLVWNADSESYENASPLCYHSIEQWIVTKTTPGTTWSLIVKRHHQELFTPGASIIAAMLDGTYVNFSVVAINPVIIDQSDQQFFELVVTLSSTPLVPTYCWLNTTSRRLYVWNNLTSTWDIDSTAHIATSEPLPPTASTDQVRWYNITTGVLYSGVAVPAADPLLWDWLWVEKSVIASPLNPAATVITIQLQNAYNDTDKSFIVPGHVAEKFLPGHRILVTFDDATSKVFIVDHALNINADQSVDSKLTQIVIDAGHDLSTTQLAVTIQTVYTPDYHIVGATTGTNGSWVVTGDVRDEFKIGETVIIANTAPTELGATVYTISAAPTIAQQTASTIAQVHEYNIVGFTPSHPDWYDAQNHLIESAVKGQWFIDGDHASVVSQALADATLAGNQLWLAVNVTGDTSPYHTIDSVSLVTPTDLTRRNNTIDVHQVIHGLTVGTPVKLQNNLWSPDPLSTYYVRSVDGVDDFSVNPPTTVITITRATEIPDTASASGTLRTPIIPPNGAVNRAELVTVIPVSTTIYKPRVNQHPGQFAPLSTGLLRQVPLVFNQVTEPVTTVSGAVWIDPVTNISKRWAGQWIHNYTPTQHSWLEGGSVTPTNVKILGAVSQTNNTQTNSFLVDTTDVFTSAEFAVTSTKNNELMFSNAYTITGVNSTSNTWTVNGTASVIAGEIIYVTSSSSNQGIGKYTVASVSYPTPTTTLIGVTRQISRLASADGILTVPTNINGAPKMVEGTRVRVLSTSALPLPLDTNGAYYFIPIVQPFAGVDILGQPTETPATFALSRVRKPRDYYDYVDVTTLGTGVLTLIQDEIYVPGSKINVRDSYLSRNNGSYTILNTIAESSSTTRVFVAERVKSTTPATEPHDGVMVYDTDSHVYSSLTERVCKGREQSDLNAETRITEFIEFEFTVDDFDFVATTLLENEPRTNFLRDLGFDVPANDTTGFDGSLVYINNNASMGSTGSGFVHNILPTGFDTQFFGMGGIDETLHTVVGLYSENATRQWLADK